MSMKSYKYNDKTQLTTHFRVSEWKCKCGKKHDIKIDSDLPPLLEKLMTKIGAVRGDISSGYRCPAHEKAIGGSGSNTHQGYACDIKFTDKNGKAIPSKTVVLALEDLGHKKGIGYRCGGSNIYTHIDVKPRKWYGDEKISMSKNVCNSFYDYFKIQKPRVITYQAFDSVKKKWLNKIPVGTNDYAGNFKNPMSGVRITDLTYQVHDMVKKKWLPWVTGDISYAGNLPNPIDGIRIKGAKYRAHTTDGRWWSWISKTDNTPQGYAGVYGRKIDAIQIA